LTGWLVIVAILTISLVNAYTGLLDYKKKLTLFIFAILFTLIMSWASLGFTIDALVSINKSTNGGLVS
jgi:hypothetical protein